MDEPYNINSSLAKRLQETPETGKGSRKITEDKSTNTSLRTARSDVNLDHEKLLEFLKPYFHTKPLPKDMDAQPKLNNQPTPVRTKSDDMIVKNLITEKYKNQLNSNQKRLFAHTIQKCKRIEDVNRIMSKSNSKQDSFNSIHFIQNDIKTQYTCDKQEEQQQLTDNDVISLREATPDLEPRHLHRLQMPISSTPSNMTYYSDFPDEDINTSQVSTLLSISSYIPDHIELLTPISSSTLRSSSNESFDSFTRDENLITQASFQHEVISQVTKALTMCAIGKNLSRAYLEAEKLLLLSMHRRDIVLREIHQNAYDFVNDELFVSGEVTVKNLQFFANRGESNQWFTLIAISGTKVLVTDIVAADEFGNITFLDVLKFGRLETDFEILLKLYCLTEPQEPKKSRQSKIKGIFKFWQRPSNGATRQGSRFLLWGTSKISIINLNHNSLNLIQTPISKTFLVTISSDLKIKGTPSGFLTIGSGTKGHYNWNRFWCRLEGHLFKFYIYPAHGSLAGFIDLRYCVNASINKVKRELCAKPFTLLLITARKPQHGDVNSTKVITRPGCTILMHYLSADNLTEMEMWGKSLNFIISELRNWNKMKFSLRFTNQEQCFI